MIATNVFFGGVPTGAEVNKLIEAFGVPAEGETITHEEIEAALGLAKDTNRYRTVTTAWRKKMLVDNNLDTCAVQGEGLSGRRKNAIAGGRLPIWTHQADR